MPDDCHPFVIHRHHSERGPVEERIHDGLDCQEYYTFLAVACYVLDDLAEQELRGWVEMGYLERVRWSRTGQYSNCQ